MSNQLPERRSASTLPPREKKITERSPEEVIREAPLKTNLAEQTNPIENKRAWLTKTNLSTNELWKLTKKKSFNFPLMIQEQINFIVEARKNEPRAYNEKEPNETSVILEYIIKGLREDLKRMGYDPE